jgi:exopolysaccharide biosynthesis polyprenyl glycosylphosphotransferase
VARSAEGRQATLIVGTGEVARRAARTLRVRPQRGLDVVGFVDDEPLPLGPDDPPCLGGADHIEELVRAYGIQRVIVAFSPLPVPAQVELFRRCMDLGVHVDIVPRMFEVTGARSRMHHLDGLPLVGFRPPRLSASARIGKRVLDVVLASVGLVALWPLFAYVAVRIRLESAGPVLFWQERMGAGGRPFRIVKFRSMSVDAERRKAEVRHLNCHTEPGPRMFKVPDDPRVTPFGRWLRSTSLDELPQLWNVLRGEMSLVGPRPLILEEDCQVMRHGRRRLDLTPGVTGLWQITGRSDVGLAEMLTLDYLYVTDWSLWGDLKILARTIPVVLRRSGAY